MEEFVEERWLNVKNGRRLFVRVGEELIKGFETKGQTRGNRSLS